MSACHISTIDHSGKVSTAGLHKALEQTLEAGTGCLQDHMFYMVMGHGMGT